MKKLIYLAAFLPSFSYGAFRSDYITATSSMTAPVVAVTTGNVTYVYSTSATASNIAVGPSSAQVLVPGIYNAITDPTGFLNRTSTLSFNDSNRTLTILGDHVIYINGVATTKAGGATKQIANTSGSHWVYYDKNGVLQEGASPGFDFPLVASIYWNATSSQGIVGDERHGIKMDAATHEYLHHSYGVRWEGSGLVGTFDSNASTITTGKIDDEDIEFTVPTTSYMNVLYKNGDANTFDWIASTSVYYKRVGTSTVLQYNNGANLADVPTNNYVAAWVYATNDIRTPIFSVIGQRIDTTIANARANNTVDSLTFGSGFPSQEAKLLYRVILRNVAGTPTYIEAQDLRNITNTPSQSYVASSHALLSNLNWAAAGHTIDQDLALGTYGLTGASATVTYVTASTGVFTSSVTTPGINVSTLSTVAQIVFNDGTSQTTAPSGGVAAGSTTTWTGTNVFVGSTSIKGVIDAGDAPVGYVGEYRESYVPPYRAFSTGNGTYQAQNSLTLPPGDWDITAVINIHRNNATFASTNFEFHINTTSGTPQGGLWAKNYTNIEGVVPTTFGLFGFSFPAYRVSISAETTYYLDLYMDSFSGGPPKTGSIMRARRVH